MNNSASADLGKRCASLAEDLEGDSRLVEFVGDQEDEDEDNLTEVMEHRYTISDRGDVLEVEAVVSVGGPNIWIECLSGVVAGSWGFDTHRCHVNSERVKEYGRRQAERMERRID